YVLTHVGQNVCRRLRATRLNYSFNPSPQLLGCTVMLPSKLQCFEKPAFSCNTLATLCARLTVRLDKQDLITLQLSIKPKDNSWPHLFAGIHAFKLDPTRDLTSSQSAQVVA